MFVPTELTQRRIQQLLHEMHCKPACPGDWEGWNPCKQGSVRMLGMLMLEISKEMFPAVRADEREKVAYRVECELVCCDLYTRMNEQDMTAEEYQVFSATGDYHAICHWGGYAAAIARDGDGPGHWAITSPELTEAQIRADEREKIIARLDNMRYNLGQCDGGHECGCDWQAIEQAKAEIELRNS